MVRPRISEGLMNRLQSVQNATARLVTGTRRCDHITPVLRQLHWLPVRQRVDFKLATFVHRSLSGISPTYLAATAVLSPMLVNDDYAPQRAEHASLPGHTAVLATEPLQLRGPRTMEQSSIAPERGGLTVQSISAVAKDIFVWIVGSRRSVNYFNCAA